jgi:hypothetical protein
MMQKVLARTKGNKLDAEQRKELEPAGELLRIDREKYGNRI